MPTTLTHGLAIYTTGDYLDEVAVNENIEVSERRGTNGVIAKVKDFNPTNEFDIKGGGNPAVSLGVFTGTTTGYTGGVKMANGLQRTEKSSDFDDFSLKVKHYPSGSAASYAAMRGAFIQLLDDTDPQRSDVTLLAAALVTLGIPFAGKELVHITCEPARGGTKWHTVWTFAGVSADGRFEARKMELAWSSGEWLAHNPAHPLAIIRSGLTFERALKHTPRFSLAELNRLETPDTWLEASMRNLVYILRSLPEVKRCGRGIIRFAEDAAAMVPRHWPQDQQKRLIKWVENPSERMVKR